MKLFFLISSFCMLLTSLPAYSQRVDGDFNGWTGETTVILDDGTNWIQTEYYYKYCYRYNPKVTLYREYGRIKMLVEGCGDKGVAVEQIFPKTSSSAPVGESMIGTLAQNLRRYQEARDRQTEQINNANIALAQSNSLSTIIKILNNTDNTLYYCYTAYNGTNGWQSIGWYKVEASSNTSINIGNYTGNIYLYASDGGNRSWYDADSKYFICIDKTNAFSIPNADSRPCNEPNYQKVKVAEMEVAPGVHTWTLNP